MFRVVAKIEFIFDFFHRHGGCDFWIGLQFCQEICTLLPDPHRIALHQAVTVFTAHAFLRQRQQDPLRMYQSAKLIHICDHIVRIDDQFIDHTGQAGQGKIKGDGGIGSDGPLDGAVRDIPLMPQGHVFHRRHHSHPHNARQTGEVLG